MKLPPTVTQPLWAITAYFNPMHWRRRLLNYRLFRQHLSLPLMAIELGYDGQFDLAPGDADILLQYPAKDVMWQKERLLNLALQSLPSQVEAVAYLDADVVFQRQSVWDDAKQALARTPLVQLFSHAYYVQADEPLDFASIERKHAPASSFAWLRRQGCSALELCNPVWKTAPTQPPVTWGLAWAFRRELLARHGLYDAWIIGGGMRIHCLAADGLWADAAEALRFHPPQREHFRRWAEGFYRDTRGNWECVSGAVAHLWHGDLAARKYRQRYEDFAKFEFDSSVDLAYDENGAWRWRSPKREMHQYVRDYFASRNEDGTFQVPSLQAT